MSTEIESTISSLVVSLSKIESIVAAGLSTQRLPEKKEDGDVDVFIYCTKLPDEEEKNKAYEKVTFTKAPKHLFNSKHWGSADYAEVKEIEIWIMYFVTEEVQNDIQRTVTGKNIGNDNGYYPVGRLAMYSRMTVLFERNSFLTKIKENLKIYPVEMKKEIISYCKKELKNEEDLLRAVSRQDLLFFHISIDKAIDRLLQLLFAINNAYFPSRKRNKEYICTFDKKPLDFYLRIQKVIEWGAKEETIRKSFDTFTDLRNETISLLETDCG